MINLKIDPEFQSQIPPLTDDEFKQLEENILKEGKLISPLIVWGNTLVDGHNRYEIVQEHPEISFSTMPLPFESREEVLAWICKNQLGRRNLTPEQKKFLIGKQYSVEHRKPGGNGNNQHTAAAKKTAPEELCQIDTIPPTSAEASIRKQIAERNNVSESYVARPEKFICTILAGGKKPGEVYFAAIAPDMELTVITLDEAPDILPCFDESDASIHLPDTSLLLCYNPAQVLKMAGKRYLTGPVILVRTNMDGNFISLTIDDVYRFQKFLASHSVTLMADDQKLPCICIV